MKHNLLSILSLCTLHQVSIAYGGLKVYQEEESPPGISYSTVQLKGENGKWKLKKPTEYKKPTDYLQKKYRTLEREKEESQRKKELAKGMKKTKEAKKRDNKEKGDKEVYLKDERWQLCQSLSEDSVKDSLLKFGLVTHIIPEVEKFRSAIKMLKDSLPKSKKKNGNGKKKKDKIGAQKSSPKIKLSQTNFVGRAFSDLNLPRIEDLAGFEEGFNNVMQGGREERDFSPRFKRAEPGSYLETMKKDKAGRRKGTSKNFDQVPECYGWRYLSAINALTPGDSADVEVMTQSVSDMLDMNFAETVADILQSCGDRLDDPTGICPPMEEVGVPAYAGTACVSQCLEDSECGFMELCCRQGCGGNRCVNMRGQKRHNKCGLADQYMQCIYNMIDSQLCDTRR